VSQRAIVHLKIISKVHHHQFRFRQNPFEKHFTRSRAIIFPPFQPDMLVYCNALGSPAISHWTTDYLAWIDLMSLRKKEVQWPLKKPWQQRFRPVPIVTLLESFHLAGGE
jgi:hypothetical protein